jgi:hypothetical protein
MRRQDAALGSRPPCLAQLFSLARLCHRGGLVVRLVVPLVVCLFRRQGDSWSCKMRSRSEDAANRCRSRSRCLIMTISRFQSSSAKFVYMASCRYRPCTFCSTRRSDPPSEHLLPSSTFSSNRGREIRKQASRSMPSAESVRAFRQFHHVAVGLILALRIIFPEPSTVIAGPVIEIAGDRFRVQIRATQFMKLEQLVIQLGCRS